MTLNLQRQYMIIITSHSGIYTLQVKQKLKMGISEAWEFFSSPQNLSKITPPNMGFVITSNIAEKMFAGQIITYEVGVFPRVKMYWVTEITQVEKNKFFVDEQRFGPYSMWHHEHHFEIQEDGVMITDRVSYKLPFGVLGRLFHPFLIKPQLMKIFSYRIKKLDNLFKS